jgi:hypothetical protein
MKFSIGMTLVFLALSNVDAVAIPAQQVRPVSTIYSYNQAPINLSPCAHILTLSSRTDQKTLSARASRIDPLRRQIVGGSQRQNETQPERKPQRQKGGGLTIGGLTLGGPNGGLSAGTLQLGGNQKGNGQQQVGEQNRNATEAATRKAPSTEVEKPAAKSEKPSVSEVQTPAEKGAGAGTENQPGRAEGEAAKEEALAEAKQQGKDEAAKSEKSNGVKATEESERFSEESGITLDQDGNAQNLGGNLGITQGTDGSKSVGGENGINIASNGDATLAGNE